eukprot:746391-Hanusia_phi.AAC.10
MTRKQENSSKKRKRQEDEDETTEKRAEDEERLDEPNPALIEKTKKIVKSMKRIGESLGMTFSGPEKLEVSFEPLWEDFPKLKRIKKLPEEQKEKAASRIFAICTRAAELSSKLLHRFLRNKGCRLIVNRKFRFGDKHSVGGVAGLGIEMSDELVARVEKKASKILDNQELWKRTLGASRRCVNASLKHMSDVVLQEHLSDHADPEDTWADVAQPDADVNDEVEREEEGGGKVSSRSEGQETMESGVSGFMEWYMSKFTDSFAEELDSIRSKEELDANGVSLLVDAIKSGVDVIPKVERVKEARKVHPRPSHPARRPRDPRVDITRRFWERAR